MFAIVEAEMSTRLSAPRCSRSGDSGALVSENGTDAASLMVSLPASSHSRSARRVWQALSGSRENTESDKHAQDSAWWLCCRWLCCRGSGPRAVPQHALAGDRDDARLLRRLAAEHQPGGDLAEPLERQ